MEVVLYGQVFGAIVSMCAADVELRAHLGMGRHLGKAPVDGLHNPQTSLGEFNIQIKYQISTDYRKACCPSRIHISLVTERFRKTEGTGLSACEEHLKETGIIQSKIGVRLGKVRLDEGLT